METCNKIGKCVDAYIDDVERQGKKFFEGSRCFPLVCYAVACRRNNGKHCVMMDVEGNIFSVDEQGQCKDFYPGRAQG